MSKTFQIASVAVTTGAVSSLIAFNVKDSKLSQLIGKVARIIAIMAAPFMIFEAIKEAPPYIAEVTKAVVASIKAKSTIDSALKQAEAEQIAANKKLEDAKRAIGPDHHLVISQTDCKVGRPADIMISACNALIASFPNNWEPHSIISTAYRMKGDLNSALAHINSALALQPNDPISLLRRGMIRRGLLDEAGALRDFETVRQITPLTAPEYIARGMAYELVQASNFLNKAIDDYDAAIQLDSTQSLAYANKAEALLTSKRPEKALDEVNRAIQLDSTNAGYFDTKGRVSAALGLTRDAIDSFRRSIDLDPTSPTAHRNRGQMLLKEKRYTEAVADLEKAAALTPNDADTFALLGLAYLRDNKRASAADACRRAQALDASHASALACLKMVSN